MTIPSPDDLERILTSSEFPAALKPFIKKKLKSRLFGASVRPLSAREIKILKTNGNHAQAWKNIVVHKKFDPAGVINTIFSGNCVLGCFDAAATIAFGAASAQQGIYNCIISNSEIGNGCAVFNANISNYCVKEHSLISGVGSLTCAKRTCFGNGKRLPVGIETGGREIAAFAELTLALAQAVALQRSDREFINQYQRTVEAYCARCTMDIGIVESNCFIRNTPTIENSYIGKNARIDTALLVSECTVLSSAEEPTEIRGGAMVSASCVQWGCGVSSMAIVEESVLLEHCRVKRHGKVTSSVIGPNTVIAEGEVTSCLVGPFVGFHHQALLIAALWPKGKGNVGYGANVGSNHTGKAPDQELWCGEGVFFGLGVNIKFPANFTNAPYSLFATGVTTLPQSIEFPFSLIAPPSGHIISIPSSFNEIFPGWVLWENFYMIKRTEDKCMLRNKARRTALALEVFRSEILDLMVTARNRLRDGAPRNDCYTSREIPGLGKNFMTEQNRVKGVAAYDFFIEYYCLRGLLRQILKLKVFSKELFAGIYNKPTTNSVWEHQRVLLSNEGFAKRSLRENLQRLIILEELITQSTQRSKEKDDVRGAGILPDYNTVHCLAENDFLIKDAWQKMKKMKKEVTSIVEKLGH